MTNQSLIFQKKSKPIPISANDIYHWHNMEGTIERLIPPWQNVTIIERSGGLGLGGKTVLNLKLGPFHKLYVGEHLEEDIGKMFTDIQVKGPFKYWKHEHKFTNISIAGKAAAIIDDKINYGLPLQQYLPTPIKKYVHRDLEKTFHYRHATTRNDLLAHKKYNCTSKNILISGASGSIGKHLVPFLTSGGHKVWRLVRRSPAKEANEIFWNPKTGEVGDIPQIDGIIHLAGEAIGLARWNKEKKNEVLLSRKLGTQTIAKLAVKLNVDFLISSSATGFYGDSPNSYISEEQKHGEDFISQVCKEWEDATEIAKEAGIRTVLLRMGAVLDGGSGVLRKLSSTGLFAVPKYFGSGKQMMSWICMDDLIYAIFHCTATDIEGPLNICSPEPISNKEFMKTIASIGNKILLPPIPSAYLRLVYGQMADEIALANNHVTCQKLIHSGFDFQYPDIKSCLQRQLGYYLNQ